MTTYELCIGQTRLSVGGTAYWHRSASEGSSRAQGLRLRLEAATALVYRRDWLFKLEILCIKHKHSEALKLPSI